MMWGVIMDIALGGDVRARLEWFADECQRHERLVTHSDDVKRFFTNCTSSVDPEPAETLEEDNAMVPTFQYQPDVDMAAPSPPPSPPPPPPPPPPPSPPPPPPVNPAPASPPSEPPATQLEPRASGRIIKPPQIFTAGASLTAPAPTKKRKIKHPPASTPAAAKAQEAAPTSKVDSVWESITTFVKNVVCNPSFHRFTCFC